MKFGVSIFMLLFAVTSSQSDEDGEKCYQKYTNCAVPVINEWEKRNNCSVAVPFLKCITNATRQCSPYFVPYVENYQDLAIDICDSDGSRKEEWKKAQECTVKNSNNFLNCTTNLTNLEEGTCKATSDSVACITSTMNGTCGKFAAEFAERVLFPFAVLAEECQKIEEAEECMMKNSDKIVGCELNGEFNDLGDICSSFGGMVECYILKYKVLCGEEAEKFAQLYTDDFTFLMKTCKNLNIISGISIPECNKNLLKCNVNLFNLHEPNCTDVSTYVGCVADSAKICVGDERPLYLIILEKYKSKFSVYCAEDSAFNKYLPLKYDCLSKASKNTTGACYDKLEKDIQEVKKDDKVGKLRAYVNFIECLLTDFRNACGYEAEYVMQQLLSPLEESMDESCIILTGKKCNRAVGLEAGMWLIIAALTFLLTRKNE